MITLYLARLTTTTARRVRASEVNIPVLEGYILVHAGYIPVHAGYIPVHAGYINSKSGPLFPYCPVKIAIFRGLGGVPEI